MESIIDRFIGLVPKEDLEELKRIIEEKDREIEELKSDNYELNNRIKEQEKVIDEYEKECRQFKAFCRMVRKRDKHDIDLFNQGQEQKCNQFLNLLAKEPHWSYEGKYFDETDKEIDLLNKVKENKE